MTVFVKTADFPLLKLYALYKGSEQFVFSIEHYNNIEHWSPRNITVVLFV